MKLILADLNNSSFNVVAKSPVWAILSQFAEIGPRRFYAGVQQNREYKFEQPVSIHLYKAAGEYDVFTLSLIGNYQYDLRVESLRRYVNIQLARFRP